MDAPSGHVRVDVRPEEVTVSYIKASLYDDNRSVLTTHVIQP